MLGIDARVELDEAEVALRVEKALADLAELGEEILEVAFGDILRHVANKQATSSRELLLRLGLIRARRRRRCILSSAAARRRFRSV